MAQVTNVTHIIEPTKYICYLLRFTFVCLIHTPYYQQAIIVFSGK